MTREILLTRGHVALVDEDDYYRLREWSWHYLSRYAVRSVGPQSARTKLAMHREIMDPPAGLLVDHINGNTLDNRRCNLRVCTAAQNARNVRRQAPSTSRFKGVDVPLVGRVKARLHVDGRYLHLGTFRTEIAAACAYDDAAEQHFGEFALLNFPRSRDWIFTHDHQGEWPMASAAGGARAALEDRAFDQPEAEEAEPLGPPNLDLFERVAE